MVELSWKEDMNVVSVLMVDDKEEFHDPGLLVMIPVLFRPLHGRPMHASSALSVMVDLGSVKVGTVVITCDTVVYSHSVSVVITLTTCVVTWCVLEFDRVEDKVMKEVDVVRGVEVDEEVEVVEVIEVESGESDRDISLTVLISDLGFVTIGSEKSCEAASFAEDIDCDAKLDVWFSCDIISDPVVAFAPSISVPVLVIITVVECIGFVIVVVEEKDVVPKDMLSSEVSGLLASVESVCMELEVIVVVVDVDDGWAVEGLKGPVTHIVLKPDKNGNPDSNVKHSVVDAVATNQGLDGME